MKGVQLFVVDGDAHQQSERRSGTAVREKAICREQNRVSYTTMIRQIYKLDPPAQAAGPTLLSRYDTYSRSDDESFCGKC